MRILTKENYGDIKNLEKLGRTKNNSFTIEQLLDENFKNIDGESRKEVTNRMEIAFNRVLLNNLGKNIAIVSHGASIKFLLMKWCKLNKENMIEFGGKSLILNSPGILKLSFDDNNLIKVTQVL